jgi:acetyl-CoA carboxylase biotin carboxyl carrier protein
VTLIGQTTRRDVADDLRWSIRGDADVPFDVSEIRKVLDAFEKSSCSEVSLRSGDFELVITVDGDGRSPAPSETSAHGRSTVDLSDKSSTVSETRPAAVTGAVSNADDAPDTSAALETAGETVHVLAPSVGIFWRSPQPGAPAFVDVGDDVGPNTTTCIVEVMKLMNHVKAGAAGRVVAVHPANGDQVKTGQPLFTVALSSTVAEVAR